MGLCEIASIFIAGIVVVSAIFDGLRGVALRPTSPLFTGGATRLNGRRAPGWA